jgi:hypothetical protein
MRVYVYFNLHKKLWSVRALDGAQRGRVIAHAHDLRLADCSFRVSEAGRQRVIRERCKNVHAGVVGTLLEASLPQGTMCEQRITYDPYRFATFVDAETLAPIAHARFVVFSKRAVHVAA